MESAVCMRNKNKHKQNRARHNLVWVSELSAFEPAMGAGQPQTPPAQCAWHPGQADCARAQTLLGCGWRGSIESLHPKRESPGQKTTGTRLCEQLMRCCWVLAVESWQTAQRLRLRASRCW